MGTKNHPGKFDCYANAAPDEPMFVLLGRDPLAGVLVRVWAAVRIARGESVEKCLEALQCASAMDRWVEGLGKVRLGGYDVAAREILRISAEGAVEILFHKLNEMLSKGIKTGS